MLYYYIKGTWKLSVTGMQSVYSPLVQFETCVGMWSCEDVTLSHHSVDKKEHNQSRWKIKIKKKVRGNEYFFFTAGIRTSDNQTMPVHPMLTTILFQLQSLYQALHFSCRLTACVCQDCAPPQLLLGAMVIPLHILKSFNSINFHFVTNSYFKKRQFQEEGLVKWHLLHLL